MSALVGVIMGSKSDWSTLSHTAETLERLGIEHEIQVISAHRTPGPERPVAARSQLALRVLLLQLPHQY